MKNLILGILVGTLATSSVRADMTGAGDAAILQELVAQSQTMLKQLHAVKDTLDVSRQLAEMEQLKTIREVSNEGNQLRSLIGNAQEGYSLVTSTSEDPFGLKSTQSEIDYIQASLETARSSQSSLQSARSYANILSDLKRLKFLGQANAESIKKISEGTDDIQNKAITASNTSIMAQLMIEDERRKAAARASDSETFIDMLHGVNYQSMTNER